MSNSGGVRLRLCVLPVGRTADDEARLLGIGLVRPSEAERARQQALPTRSAQLLYGPALLRYLVGEETGNLTSRIELRYGPFGRPECDVPIGDAPALSLTHHGSVIAAALSRHGLIGVDIEPIQHAAMALELASDFLHPDEASALATSEDAATAALLMWTQKEAYLKAIGMGLQIDPRTVALSNLTADGGGWSIRSASISGALLLSVATRGGTGMDLTGVRLSRFPWDNHVG